MSTSADMIRVALAALLAGVALPLLVQLFLTLRGLRRAADTIERRLDQTLRDVSDLAAGLRRNTAAPAPLGAVIAAATPVVVAAVRAFRSSLHDQQATNHHDKEKSP